MKVGDKVDPTKWNKTERPVNHLPNPTEVVLT